MEWFRHDAMLIPHPSETKDRIIAVRETTKKLRHAVLSFDVKERLSILADSIVHLGYGRVRIYRATGKIEFGARPLLQDMRLRMLQDTEKKPWGLKPTRLKMFICAEHLKEKDGTLTESIDTEYRLDPASRLRICQEPPWIDVPIFLDSEFVGWLAVDTVGATRRELGMIDIQKLAPFREELRQRWVGSRQQRAMFETNPCRGSRGSSKCAR